jgi:hypothetical protein
LACISNLCSGGEDCGNTDSGETRHAIRYALTSRPGCNPSTCIRRDRKLGGKRRTVEILNGLVALYYAIPALYAPGYRRKEGIVARSENATGICHQSVVFASYRKVLWRRVRF